MKYLQTPSLRERELQSQVNNMQQRYLTLYYFFSMYFFFVSLWYELIICLWCQSWESHWRTAETKNEKYTGLWMFRCIIEYAFIVLVFEFFFIILLDIPNWKHCDMLWSAVRKAIECFIPQRWRVNRMAMDIPYQQ